MKNRWAALVVCLMVLLSACELPLVLEESPAAPSPSPTTSAPSQATPPASPAAETPTAFDPQPTSTSPQQADRPPTNPAAGSPTATPEIPPFIVQPGAPVAIPNFTHNEEGCNWMGVGGQTFDTDGNPVKFIVVEVGGELVGNEVSMLSLTGSVPAYGPAGYEFTLASAPIGTSGTLWLQLYDLEGNPLSERVFIDTHSSCDRNLVIVNFIKLPAQLSRSYLPSVMNALFPTETPTLEPTP